RCRPSSSALFPYATLFRSHSADVAVSIKNASLSMVQPYLAAFLEPKLTGTLDGEVGLQWQAPAADQKAGATGVKASAGPLSLSTDRKSTRLNSSHVKTSYA